MVQEHPLKTAINRALLAMLGDNELVDRWWTTPNRRWSGATPQECWEQNPTEVKNYILEHLQK